MGRMGQASVSATPAGSFRTKRPTEFLVKIGRAGQGSDRRESEI